MSCAATQRGRTLIEILIAITIGLMLTAGILSIFGANRQTYRASTDLQRMQAGGQLALDRLAYQVRMAGYGQLVGNFASVTNPSTFTGNPVFACAGGFQNPVDVSQTPACNGGATPDGLQVRYQVDNAAVAGSGENRDCLGFAVPVDASGFRTVQNRFYIAQSNAVPTLMCAGNGLNPGLNPAPLIPNVEDFQVRLRIGDAFTRAEQVVDPNLYSAWDRVLGIELCVQVRSEEMGVSAGQTAGTDCSGNAFANDGRLHRTFTQVVTLRNRIL